MARSNVRSGIINPGATTSLTVFLFGSIIAGFAAGLGWGLATKMLEKGNNEVQAYRSRVRRNNRALLAARYSLPNYYRY